jgi:hypothetical protein
VWVCVWVGGVCGGVCVGCGCVCGWGVCVWGCLGVCVWGCVCVGGVGVCVYSGIDFELCIETLTPVSNLSYVSSNCLLTVSPVTINHHVSESVS